MELINLHEIPAWVQILFLYSLVYAAPYFISYFVSKRKHKKLQKEQVQREQEVLNNINLKEKVQMRQVNKITQGSFISSEEFNNTWIMPNFTLISKTKSKNGFLVDLDVHEKENKYGNGLKYMDKPGCYVILVFDKPIVDGDFSNYRDVYVGQSVNMYQRVHNHFNGKGNGDVYADIKYGKSVYVQFFPCREEELNCKEKELIKLFNATKSYNKTSGGSAAR